MIPYLLTIAGAYLIGNSVNSDGVKYADGGLIAPNGKKSNLTPEQYKLVRTPEFKAWFGDWENNPELASKVVDENGEPMVVYHGVISREDWNTYEYFDNDKPYENPDINPIGIYMSNNLEEASNYGFGSVKKMFCKIMKPLDLSKTKTHTLKQWLVILSKAGLYVDNIKFDSCFIGDYAKYDSYDSKGEYMTQSQINNVKYLWWELIKINSYWSGDGNLLTEIIKQKFDGIFYPENPDESKGKISECIAFYPTQIKLADGTNTTFDSSNPDIRFAKGGKILKAEDMLKHPLTIETLKDLDGEMGLAGESWWADRFHAKTINYKPNTYYHLNTGGLNAGVGKGLYLGRDKDALIAFYDVEEENKTVDTYVGKPNWLDLIDYKDYELFEEQAVKKYGKPIDVKSISDIDRKGEMMKKLAIDKGYDGIRYYDPQASGEEFVLFNTKKVKKVSE